MEEDQKCLPTFSAPPPPPPPPPPPHHHHLQPSFVHGDHHHHHHNTNNVNNNEIVVQNDVVVPRNVVVARNVVPQSEYPAGYRFCPLDGELIVHYLMKKIKNQPLPHDKIKEVDLYRVNPADLSEKYCPVGDREWYFFTPRKRKYPNGIRPNRAAGKGYWKATGADKPVMYGKERVGFRKALVYYQGKPPKGDKTNWIMHEYKADAPQRARKDSKDMTLDDWVLCRIYYKEDKDSKSQPRNRELKADEPPLSVSEEPNLAMENNDLAVMDVMENLSEPPMNAYGYDYHPAYQNVFLNFADFSNPNNGEFQQPFLNKERLISTPFFSEARGLRSSHYHEDNSMWDYCEEMNHDMLQNFRFTGDVLNTVSDSIPPPNDPVGYVVTDNTTPEDPSHRPEE